MSSERRWTCPCNGSLLSLFCSLVLAAPSCMARQGRQPSGMRRTCSSEPMNIRGSSAPLSRPSDVPRADKRLCVVCVVSLSCAHPGLSTFACIRRSGVAWTPRILNADTLNRWYRVLPNRCAVTNMGIFRLPDRRIARVARIARRRRLHAPRSRNPASPPGSGRSPAARRRLCIKYVRSAPQERISLNSYVATNHDETLNARTSITGDNVTRKR